MSPGSTFHYIYACKKNKRNVVEKNQNSHLQKVDASINYTNNIVQKVLLSHTNSSCCLNFFHLLTRKPNLEKNSIYSNKFFHNFHLSKSSFTCPRHIFVSIPRQDLNFLYNMLWSFVYSIWVQLRWAVTVCFVDTGGIDDHSLFKLFVHKIEFGVMWLVRCRNLWEIIQKYM